MMNHSMADRSQIRGLHSGMYGYSAITDDTYFVFLKRVSPQQIVVYKNKNGWNLASGDYTDCDQYFNPKPGTEYTIVDDTDGLALLLK